MAELDEVILGGKAEMKWVKLMGSEEGGVCWSHDRHHCY